MSGPTLVENFLYTHSRPCSDTEVNADCPAPDKDGWNTLLQVARQNGVTGFIYRNTRGLDVLPDHARTELRDWYQQTTFRNLDQLGETLNVLKILAASGIKAIPLKGVVASEIIFDDLGVYPSSDIDILVHPDDLDAAKQVLQTRAEYVSVPGRSEEELRASHYHYILHKKQYLLELHWNLTKRYFEVQPEFWWEGVRSVQWRGVEILELAPEKYLMYAVFRYFDHCFYPLRFLVLIAGIVEHYGPEICWDTLMRDCSRLKMKRLVVFTLQLVHELLVVEIPADLAEKKSPGYSALKKLCRSGMLHGIERQHLRMMCYTTLLDSPADVAGALLGRLVPTRGELCLRYNLPSGSARIFLYYLMNPVLLFLKKKDGR